MLSNCNDSMDVPDEFSDFNQNLEIPLRDLLTKVASKDPKISANSIQLLKEKFSSGNLNNIIEIFSLGANPDHFFSTEIRIEICRSLLSNQTLVGMLKSLDLENINNNLSKWIKYFIAFEYLQNNNIDALVTFLLRCDEIFLNKFIVDCTFFIYKDYKIAFTLYTKLRHFNVHHAKVIRDNIFNLALKQNQLDEFLKTLTNQLPSFYLLERWDIDITELNLVDFNPSGSLLTQWLVSIISYAKASNNIVNLSLDGLVKSFNYFRRIQELTGQDFNIDLGAQYFVSPSESSVIFDISQLSDKQIIDGITLIKHHFKIEQLEIIDLVLLPFILVENNIIELDNKFLELLKLYFPQLENSSNILFFAKVLREDIKLMNPGNIFYEIRKRVTHIQEVNLLNFTFNNRPISNITLIEELIKAGLHISSDVRFAQVLKDFEPFKSLLVKDYNSFKEFKNAIKENLDFLKITHLSSAYKSIGKLISLKILTRIDILKNFQHQDIFLITNLLEYEQNKDTVSKILRQLLAQKHIALPSLITAYKKLTLESSDLVSFSNPKIIRVGKDNENEFILAINELGFITPVIYKLWLNQLKKDKTGNFRQELAKEVKNLIRQAIKSDPMQILLQDFINKFQLNNLTTSQELLNEIITIIMQTDSRLDIEKIIEDLHTETDITRAQKHFPNVLSLEDSITTKVQDLLISNTSIIERAKQVLLKDLLTINNVNPKETSALGIIIPNLLNLLPSKIEQNSRYYNRLKASFNWINDDGTLAIESIDLLKSKNIYKENFTKPYFLEFAIWRNDVLSAIQLRTTKELDFPVYVRVSSSEISYFAKNAVRICTADNITAYGEAVHMDVFNLDTCEIIGNNQLYVLEATVNGLTRKVLFLRGLNQIDKFGSEEDSMEYVKKVIEWAKYFAKENNFDALLLCPHNGWHPDSNRATNIAILHQIRKDLSFSSFNPVIRLVNGELELNGGHILWQRNEGDNLKNLTEVVNLLASTDSFYEG